MKSRCKVFTSRCDAIDARSESLISQQATNATVIAGLVESTQAVVASVTALSGKLDVVASRLENFCDLTLK